MSINDKIKQILIDKNLSPSYFADEIGVQRSSISHILSGRNRPSFDIIQKIIRRFPDLGYEWIMEEDAQTSPVSAPSPGYNGRGRTQASPNDRPERSIPGLASSSTNPASYNPLPTQFGVPRNEIPAVALVGSQPQSQPFVEEKRNHQPESTQSESTTVKKIERILLFFSDGSFKEYASAT